MKRAALGLVAFASLAAAGVLLFAWSGLYNVAASTGHWPITAWFLHFAMRSSVETHARGEAPPLDSAALIERAAGHFETGCSPCHGDPEQPGDLIFSLMVPKPPNLVGNIAEWTPGQLFWIVKHGIKYAGMPAWPAPQRDDEVWAMTAFLLRLPGMSADEYAALAEIGAGDRRSPEPLRSPGEAIAAAEPLVAAACIGCHGEDGRGRPSGAFPRLDIQTPEYLARALGEYAAGLRPSGIMQPVAAALDSGAISNLAGFYGREAARPSAASPPGRPSLSGGLIATRGLPQRRIAPCAACHGLGEGPKNPRYPALNGQYAVVLQQQLRLFKAGLRGGSAHGRIMQKIAASLSEEDIAEVARFYEGLPSRSSGQVTPAPSGPGVPKT